MASIKTIDPEKVTQQELHNLLLAAVAPRPICFASTVDKMGQVNLSPFSFFNIFSSNPPIMVFSPARSGRDNSLKHTHQNIKEVPEVVINIVNYGMVEQMSLSSTPYEKGVNEFIKSGFTAVPSEKIQPPRVGEAPVAFECSVENIIELGQSPGAGNLIISRVERIHIDTKYLNSSGNLDTRLLDLVGRMGESWYTRANAASLFEIPKPIRTKGIGVDQLPKGIRESKILTGNNLGRLANVQKLPNEKEIEKQLKDEYNLQGLDKKALHSIAKTLLEKGAIEKALALLLYAESRNP